jgi:hypothetical protein
MGDSTRKKGAKSTAKAKKAAIKATREAKQAKRTAKHGQSEQEPVDPQRYVDSTS